MSRFLVLFAVLLSQINLFAIQSDTLNLDEVILKSVLIFPVPFLMSLEI